MSLKMGVFSIFTIGLVMTSTQHDFFINFIKLKFSFFMGIVYEDAYTFIVDCFYLIHKMNIMERLSV